MTELDCIPCYLESKTGSIVALDGHEPRRKTHCKQGHEFTPSTTRISVTKSAPHGYQACLTCHNLRGVARRRRRMEARAAQEVIES